MTSPFNWQGKSSIFASDNNFNGTPNTGRVSTKFNRITVYSEAGKRGVSLRTVAVRVKKPK